MQSASGLKQVDSNRIARVMNSGTFRMNLQCAPVCCIVETSQLLELYKYMTNYKGHVRLRFLCPK